MACFWQRTAGSQTAGATLLDAWERARPFERSHRSQLAGGDTARSGPQAQLSACARAPRSRRMPAARAAQTAASRRAPRRPKAVDSATWAGPQGHPAASHWAVSGSAARPKSQPQRGQASELWPQQDGTVSMLAHAHRCAERHLEAIVQRQLGVGRPSVRPHLVRVLHVCCTCAARGTRGRSGADRVAQ